MYTKLIWIAFVTIAVLPADGKKSKKKYNSDDLEPTPQPNVLTYSTFGFNDVGSFNGFVPSSPDFATNPNSNSQEPHMRLYAPAFPSSLEATGLGSYYDSDQTSFSTGNDEQTNLKSYQPTGFNFLNYDFANEKNNAGTKEILELNDDKTNHPIYGTKINSKVRNKPNKGINNTEYNILDSVSSVIENNYNNDYNPNIEPSHQPQSTEGQNNLNYPSLSSSVSFPKVVDFTNAKKYYPTSVESKYTTLKPVHLDVFQTNGFNDNSYNNDHRNVNEFQTYKTQYNGKDGNDYNDKEISQVSFLNSQDSLDSYSQIKDNFKTDKFKPEYKNKVKAKTKLFNNNNDDAKKYINAIKGYEYSTNYSSASFHIDDGNSKQPYNSSIDEVLPESSNLDFVDYRLPDKDFTSSKSLPAIKFNTADTISLHDYDTYKPSQEYLKAFKNYYSPAPSTASNWGNILKTKELSSPKKQSKKPYLYDDDNDEIVHIPKRPNSSKYGKYFDSTPSEWPYTNEYKSLSSSITKQPEWTKDFIKNKFKTEEDLLGLRNQDDLSSSYLPSFKYTDLAKDFDYDKLSEKWRQNFLKSRNKDSNRDYDTYASDTKAIHVPRPKPYAIEIPHPVIVPVPQPYPVKVPIPKPVAVPVIQEITVPIERPMPYPVYKKVPYIVEKLVPVPVEKQVRVPVEKPYPVHVPQVRPVFHHTKYDDHDDEEEYEARPDTIGHHVYNRYKNTRSRPRPTTRRPTRMTYRDHNQRRRPARRPVYHKRPRRPSHSVDRPSRYHEDFEDSDSDFERYCKRTGKC